MGKQPLALGYAPSTHQARTAQSSAVPATLPGPAPTPSIGFSSRFRPISHPAQAGVPQIYSHLATPSLSSFPPLLPPRLLRLLSPPCDTLVIIISDKYQGVRRFEGGGGAARVFPRPRGSQPCQCSPLSSFALSAAFSPLLHLSVSSRQKDLVSVAATLAYACACSTWRTPVPPIAIGSLSGLRKSIRV